MAKPLSRMQIVSVKAAAVAVMLWIVLIAAAAAAAGILAGVKAGMDVQTSVTPAVFFRVVLSAWPVSMAVAMTGLFLGSMMPSRTQTGALTGVVLGVGFFGENLAGMSEKLENLKPLFLFSYYDSSSKVFSEGVSLRDVLVLLAVATATFILALICFNNRDVTTGRWVWQRGRMNAPDSN